MWLIISTFVELLFSLAWCLWEWQLAEQMQSDCRVTPCSTSFDEKVFISQCELPAARSDNASLGRKDGWKLNLFCRMKMNKMDTLAYDYTYTTLHIKYWVSHVLFIKALSLIFENFKAKIKKILIEQRTEEWCFTISTFQWIQFFSRPDYYWSQFSGILSLHFQVSSFILNMILKNAHISKTGPSHSQLLQKTLADPVWRWAPVWWRAPGDLISAPHCVWTHLSSLSTLAKHPSHLPLCFIMAKALHTGGIQDDAPGPTLEKINTFIFRIRRWMSK